MYQKNQDESNFFVIFPTILLEKVSSRQAILMGILISHSKKEGYCFASNEYLSNILRISIDSLQRDLRSLEDQKLIRREMITINGETARQIYPLMANLQGGGPQESHTPTAEMQPPPPQECGTINISHNKEINKKDNNRVGSEKLINLFPQVWEFYGRIGNRKNALAKWIKLSESDFRAIVDHLPKYIEAHRIAKKMEFLPHFTTYLNQRRWEDEIPYQSEIKKSVPQRGIWE